MDIWDLGLVVWSFAPHFSTTTTLSIPSSTPSDFGFELDLRAIPKRSSVLHEVIQSTPNSPHDCYDICDVCACIFATGCVVWTLIYLIFLT